MRQIANQFFVGLRLVKQPFLSVLSRLLLDGQQLNNDLVSVVRLRHDDMHWQSIFWIDAQQLGVVAQSRKFIGFGACQGMKKRLWIRKKLQKRLTV